MRAVVLCMAVGLAGCEQMGVRSELEQLGECARAINLQAEAMVRADEIRERPIGVASTQIAMEALTAAARYRDKACEHDQYVSQQ